MNSVVTEANTPWDNPKGAINFSPDVGLSKHPEIRWLINIPH